MHTYTKAHAHTCTHTQSSGMYISTCSQMEPAAKKSESLKRQEEKRGLVLPDRGFMVQSSAGLWKAEAEGHQHLKPIHTEFCIVRIQCHIKTGDKALASMPGDCTKRHRFWKPRANLLPDCSSADGAVITKMEIKATISSEPGRGAEHLSCIISFNHDDFPVRKVKFHPFII